MESLSGLQCARALKNFLRGKEVPWLFTGTISVRSRFTGPTPVARFSIVVITRDDEVNEAFFSSGEKRQERVFFRKGHFRFIAISSAFKGQSGIHRSNFSDLPFELYEANNSPRQISGSGRGCFVLSSKISRSRREPRSLERCRRNSHTAKKF